MSFSKQWQKSKEAGRLAYLAGEPRELPKRYKNACPTFHGNATHGGYGTGDAWLFGWDEAQKEATSS